VSSSSEIYPVSSEILPVSRDKLKEAIGLRDCGGVEMRSVLELLGTAELETTLHSLPRHALDTLRHSCGKVIESKYRPHRLKKPLYANLPREMSSEQVFQFFEELRRFGNEGVVKAFLRQFFYGLRVGEINSCKIVPGNYVMVTNHKDGGTVDYLPVIPGTEELFEPIKNYSSGYLRKYFTETCDRLGDDFRYQYATDRKGRLRRQFTTHTLRKTAANIIRTHTKDAYKASVFLRHETRAVYGVTAVYLHYPLEEMREDLTKAFSQYLQLTQPRQRLKP
jgi:hypothetical protein